MDRLHILVIGAGGREHALAWRLSRDAGTARLFCAPGNPGMAAIPGVTCIPIPASDPEALISLVQREAIRLVVIGPEAPLAAGLSDALRARCPGTAVFGCSARAAAIETSKVFAKGFMHRHGIPTAAFHVLSSPAEADRLLCDPALASTPFVIKADGLCAGKGVTLCADPAQARDAAQAILATGASVIAEERLIGREASCMALVDGEAVLMLPACEDHKTLLDGDVGPMTGGMGAICPTPVVTDLIEVRDQILRPAARGLVAEGRPFHGLLYAGMMFTAAGPRVLEFNCRFGDPETQPLMLLLDEDLGPLLLAVAEQRLASREATPVRVRPGAAACVVIAAAGYPGDPRPADLISGLDHARALAAEEDLQLFHAGTQRDPSGALRTAGGRVLGVTSHGADLASARALAYRAVHQIHIPGATHRSDIGGRPA